MMEYCVDWSEHKAKLSGRAILQEQEHLGGMILGGILGKMTLFESVLPRQVSSSHYYYLFTFIY